MILKVISLNLWWGGKFLPAIIEFFRKENPDVIMLQEVYASIDQSLPVQYRSIESLQAELPYPHAIFDQSFIHDSDVGLVPQGNAIVSRFPLRRLPPKLMTESDRQVFKDEPEDWPILPRLLQHGQLQLAIGAVDLFNLHGVWDLDGDNYSPARQQMSQTIIEEVRSLPHVILAGDSNAKRTNQAMVEIEKTLKPVFGPELKTTFNMRHKSKPGYATAAVDLMFVSPDIQILSKDCPEVDISDHLPIIVTLKID